MPRQTRIEDLEAAVDGDTIPDAFPWIDPQQISGIDREVIRNDNTSPVDPTDLSTFLETDDQTIVDYICAHLRHHENVPLVEARRFITAAIYLIVELYSGAAALLLPAGQVLLDKSNIDDCLALLRQSYQDADVTAKILLKNFILDLVDHQENVQSDFEAMMSEDSSSFVHRVAADQFPPYPG